MAGMSDKDWETLHENFDTADLPTAVDSLDALRGYLNDREHFQPPEMRGELLKLHGLAMKVVHDGVLGRSGELFDLADDLEEQVGQMMRELEQITDTLEKLTSLRPRNLDPA